MFWDFHAELVDSVLSDHVNARYLHGPRVWSSLYPWPCARQSILHGASGCCHGTCHLRSPSWLVFFHRIPSVALLTNTRWYHLHYCLSTAHRPAWLRLDCQGYGIRHARLLSECIPPFALGRRQYGRYQLWHCTEAFRQGGPERPWVLVLYLCQFFPILRCKSSTVALVFVTNVLY